MSPFQVFLYGVAGMFVLFFAAIGLLALISAILTLKRGWADIESAKLLTAAAIKEHKKGLKK